MKKLTAAGRPSQRPDISDVYVASLYDSGMNSPSIARKLGMSHCAIWMRLRRMKHKLRPRILNAPGERARKHLVNRARNTARKHNVPFGINYTHVVIPAVCPLLGIPIFHGKGTHSDNSPSIDRIIPSLGYTPENIWVISLRANRIKNDSSPEELIAIAEGVKKEMQARILAKGLAGQPSVQG